MQNTMIIDSRDNVIVAIEPITQRILSHGCVMVKKNTLTALQDITIYHKIACRDIVKGMPVIKYGEHIGIAVADIKAGEHVHIHNVEGHRENLEAKVK